MRIVVCMKQVYDPKTVKISRSREEFDLREAVTIPNPPDKFALEAALRLREAVGGEVMALTVGGAEAEDVAHEAVAIGADCGVLATGPELTGAAGAIITRVIAAAVGRLAPIDLVLTGQVGLTDGTGALAARLAAALDWPVLLDVVGLNVEADGLMALVADGKSGSLVPVTTPAVVAIQPGSGRPRYPHPARIANAWNPGMVAVWTTVDLRLSDLASDSEMGGLILGPERTRGQVIQGSLHEAAVELVGILKARRLI